MNDNNQTKILKYLNNPGQFLLNTGVLFEINRRILHPLGLSMQVEKTTAGDIVSVIGRTMINIMESDSKSGIVYNAQTFTEESEKYQKFKATKINGLAQRKMKLGFIEQKMPVVKTS